MRILQIKQAECALADGRLDEACELIARGDLRSHRRGQELVGRLVRELLVRGAGHLAAGHMEQALADCQKAIELGGNLPEAAELRTRITRELEDRQRQQHRQGELLTTARQHVEDGRLSVAEALLADAAPDSTRADTLRREAAARRSATEAAITRAEAALARGDHAAAIDEVLTARAQRAVCDATVELAARVASAAAERARADLLRGRADLADTLLGRLRPLGGGGSDVADLTGAVQQCQRAWTAVRQGEFRRAAEALRLAQAILPEAAWLLQAAASADEAAQAAETLRVGPLAMLSAAAVAATEWAGWPPAQSAETDGKERPMVLPPIEELPPAGGEMLPEKFLLRVDGAGCSVVLRRPCVTVGPISSPQVPDLGLLADPSLPVVTIERTEGDYFLRSEAPIAVNDRLTTGKLLTDGDKISLSPRCRLRFRLPNAASSSAVLELSTARLPQTDVRRVVLMDRDVVLGPGAAAHIRADHLATRAVLHVRQGCLACRTEAEMTVDHRPLEPGSALPMDTPVRLGALGLVVSRA